MDVSASARSTASSSPSNPGTTAGTTAGSASAGHAARANGASRERATSAAPFASLLAAARGRPAPRSPLGAGHAKDAAAGAALDEARDSALGATGRKPAKRSGDAESDGEPETAPGTGAMNDALPTEAEEEAARARAGAREESDWLDPSARQAAQLAPPGTLGHPADVTSAQNAEPVRARSLEELLPALVKRIAWAGDRHKGTVRLELGAGAYAGTTVVVHADGGRVRVEIGGQEGPELDRLRARLDTRLRGHGLDVESVT